MPRLCSTSILKDRTILTPAEAARVFGRSGDYWRKLFDGGKVSGRLLDGRRYLFTASIERYLFSEGAAFAPAEAGKMSLAEARAQKIDWEALGL